MYEYIGGEKINYWTTTFAPKLDWSPCCRFFVPFSHPAVVNFKKQSYRSKRDGVLVEPSVSKLGKSATSRN